MTRTITKITAHDVRFPTSRDLDGSDAMNQAPDYSAAYALIETDAADGLVGHGMTFTIGRGNEICAKAIEALAPLVVGQTLEAITDDMGGFWRSLAGESQLRWIGPEKGVIHLATAAIVNAMWDLWAQGRGQAGLETARRHDARANRALHRLPPHHRRADAAEALDILRRNAPTKPEREREMRAKGYPAYTTSAGWLGYSDEKLRRLCREALAKGWTHFKIKVGADIDDDLRRARLIREEIGYDRTLMIDANQVWEVNEAIE